MKKYFKGTRKFLILIFLLICTTISFSDNFREDIVQRVNIEREKIGLNPVIETEELDILADKKAKIMADEENLSHTAGGYKSFSEIFKEAGIEYITVGENIASGWKTNDEVMKAWMDSKGHRANILNEKFTHMGAGKAVSEKTGKIYWVQLFIKYKN